MDRDLDALDRQPLRAMQTHGELSAANLALQRRLDRLEMEGYAASARNHAMEADAWIYRITEKGFRAISS